MMPFRHKDIRGWTYIGRTVLTRLSEEDQKNLSKMDDAITIKYTRMSIRYVNSGNITASGKVPIIDMYRRLNGKRGCIICGFVAKEGEATKHLHDKHPETYGKMDYLSDYYNCSSNDSTSRASATGKKK